KAAEAKKLISHFEDSGIKVQHGRYGPFITDGNLNASVPKGEDAAALAEEQCREILDKNGKTPRGRRGKAAAKKTTTKQTASRSKTTKSGAPQSKPVKSTTKKTTSKSKTGSAKADSK